MRRLLSTRAFWLVMTAALVALSTASWVRHDTGFGVVYLALALIAGARALYGSRRGD